MIAEAERAGAKPTVAAATATRRLVARDYHCPSCGRYVTTAWAPDGISPKTLYVLGKCETCRAWRRFDAAGGRPAARFGPILID